MDSPYQDGLTFGECFVRQVDIADLLFAGQDHHHDLRRLKEVHRLGHRSEQKTRNANGPQLACGGLAGFPERTRSLRLRRTIPCPGLEDRIVEIGQLFGRLPSGHTSFETYGRAGSCCTGLGPLGGGMNWRL
jgi:hypothetical protein